MSKLYLAVITIDDRHGFNQLRDEAMTFLKGTPDWVESMRITEATSYTVNRNDD